MMKLCLTQVLPAARDYKPLAEINLQAFPGPCRQRSNSLRNRKTPPPQSAPVAKSVAKARVQADTWEDNDLRCA